MNDATDKHEKQIATLKLENKRLKQKIKFLEIKVTQAEKRCACFRNNQKLSEESNENR
jgi:septal ring factor EnvC (AmiA/AmiB activator)